MIKERRDFLAGLGKTGALLAAGPWLRAIGYAQSARGPARVAIRRSPRSRRVRPASARLVPRASRPRDLYRRLRARIAARRRARAFAPTWHAKSRNSAYRSCAIRAATSSPDTTGSTASVRRRSGRSCWTAPGTRPRRTSSAPTSSSSGAGWSAPSRLLGLNFGTGSAEMAVAYVEYCNLERGTQVERPAARARLRAAAQRAATGASATRWTARGRSASCRRASTAARRATSRSRCGSSTPDLQLIACGSSAHVDADLPDLGSRSARGMLRPGGRPLAARLLRQHAGADRATAPRATWR